jgi:hypothetical protein
MNQQTPHPFFLFWYGGLLFLGGPLIVLGHFHILNVLLSIPFFVASVFFFSIAQISLSGDHLRYRHFLKWRVIPYKQVRNCRTHWVFGYLKTKHYILPWGALYFTRSQVGLGWDQEVIAELHRRAKLD